MRLLLLCTLLMTAILSKAQEDSTSTFYFKEIDWSISIPKKYSLMDSTLQQQLQQKGLQAISEAYDKPINVQPYKTLFAIRPNPFAYIDAVLKRFNPKVDGNWNETSDAVNQMLVHTFSEKMGGAHIDTLTTSEEIGGMFFKRFDITIQLPNDKGTMKMHMYTTLINGYDFGVNILYFSNQETMGKEFLNLWRQSKFDIEPTKITPRQ